MKVISFVAEQKRPKKLFGWLTKLNFYQKTCNGQRELSAKKVTII